MEIDKNALTLTIEGNIAHLVLNRPRVKNALNRDIRARLVEVTSQLKSDSSVRVVVVSGSGDCFSAGADIQELVQIRDESHARAYIVELRESMRSLARLPIPTIAAIEGIAFGGGMELALWCDLRVVGRNARVGFPEVGLGAVPAAGATQLLPRLVGGAIARQLCITGEPIQGQRAFELGLASKVATDGEVVEVAFDFANRIARVSMSAVASIKASLDTAWMPLDDGLDREHRLGAALFTTADHAEGTQAFLEKRVPNFIHSTTSGSEAQRAQGQT